MEKLSDRFMFYCGLLAGMGVGVDDLKHIQNLIDTEEQGLLLRLPCKVGDTVFELQEIRKRIQPMEIISVNIGRMGLLYFNWELKDGIGIYHNVKGFGASEIGKRVFLSKEAAEKKLAEMKGGNHEQ